MALRVENLIKNKSCGCGTGMVQHSIAIPKQTNSDMRNEDVKFSGITEWKLFGVQVSLFRLTA